MHTMARRVQRIGAAALALMLSACAHLGAPHLDETGLSAEIVAQLAGDAARRLSKELPPAQTQAAVAYATEQRHFGASLAAQLRTLGYAVRACDTACQTGPGETEIRYQAASPAPYEYVLLLEANELRLARPYVLSLGVLHYAGPWTKGEWKR